MKIEDTSDDTISNIHRVIKGNFNSLQFSIPPALLFHLGKFGRPDCNDGGGYILGFNLLGIHFNYEIEKGHEPWYFHDMTNVIADRLTKIHAIEKKYK
ncbi:hypothetical protein RG47T_5042 [Mucilaginibacter polytrichastri]|uniref:Uncharacterized protein n=1 Tax=Mucilaginibacter polytrichastri TaxID=1302689 RepID=A0A1Q6A6B1_9SPHI|nr:hypothetical protein RG47T_5042 [Mucilaginibacter polytrichastri]